MKWRLSLICCCTAILLASCSHKEESQSPTSGGLPPASDPYSSEQAAQNGDVVISLRGQFNVDKWKSFLSGLDQHQPGAVRITRYTTEGDPIFYELVYDGTLIHYTYDNSMDAFGSDAGRPITSCKGLEKKHLDNVGDAYVLTGCDNPEIAQTFWFN